MTRVLHIAIAALCVASCDGGGGAVSGRPGTIGGSVTGLRGTGLVLQNNGGDPLTIGVNGPFTFATPLAPFAPYSVTVLTQPTATPAEVCSVASGDGTTVRGTVTSVTITCRAATGKYLYTLAAPTVENPVNNVSSGFSIDRITGALTEIPGSPFSINGDSPANLHVDEAGKFLFIGGINILQLRATVTGYTIDAATGTLTLIPGMPITGLPLNTGGRVFFHPNGRVLYLPAGEEGLRAYSIHPTTGALALVPGAPYSPEAVGGAVNSAATTVLVNGRTGVSVFAVDATTGALTFQGTVDFSRPVREIVVHPGGKHAYLRDSEGRFAVLGIENPASLILADVPVSTVGQPSFGSVGPLFDESGRYAYFLHGSQLTAGLGSVSAYRVDTVSGALTPLAGSPYTTNGNNSRYLVMDPTRRFIAATNTLSATVAVFSIDVATGELEHVPGSPFTPAVGTSPRGVVFDPSGQFAYLPDFFSFSVSAYSFDSASGRFDFVGSYPVGRALEIVRVAGLQ